MVVKKTNIRHNQFFLPPVYNGQSKAEIWLRYIDRLTERKRVKERDNEREI